MRNGNIIAGECACWRKKLIHLYRAKIPAGNKPPKATTLCGLDADDMRRVPREKWYTPPEHHRACPTCARAEPGKD